MSQKIKTAVIGYGHLGKWHCQKAQALDSCDFVAIVELSEQGRLNAKEAHPNIEILSSVEEALNKADAFVVATPTSTHFEITKNLLLAGKHVFCEKPLCDSMKEVDELQKYLSSDLVLQVGHSERFHQVWGRVKDYIKTIPSSFHIRMNRVASFKGRATDVDVVQDLMIHDIDILNFLLDEAPVSVRSFGKKIRTDKYDFAKSTFFYKDGTMADVMVSRNHVKEVRDFEIYSSLGCLYVDLMKNEISWAPEGDINGEYVKSESYEKRDHLLIEQESFYQSILNKEPAIIGFDDGAKAIFLIDRTLISLKANTEVLINEDDEFHHH